jgi:catechol 2,3-dioxygenase
VANIEVSEKFYVDTLGFNITQKESNELFVSKDDYHHHIAMNTYAGTDLPAPPQNALGLNYFVIHFTSEEFGGALQKLKTTQYKFEESDNELIVEDPSGNVLKIINDKEEIN